MRLNTQTRVIVVSVLFRFFCFFLLCRNTRRAFTRLRVNALSSLRRFVHNPRRGPNTRARSREKSEKEEKRGHLVAISWYYLHPPGEMRWPRVQRATLIPQTGARRGDRLSPRTHVTYLYAFHFFVDKCARVARGIPCGSSRIKLGFYYKRIQIPRRTPRPSPYGARRRGSSERKRL